MVKFLNSIDFIIFVDEHDNSNLLIRKAGTMQYQLKKLFKFTSEPVCGISSCLIKIPLRKPSEEDYDVERTKLIMAFAMRNKFILSALEVKYESKSIEKYYSPEIFYPKSTDATSFFSTSSEHSSDDSFVLLH